MKISPSVIKIYKDYFNSFEKKRKIIRSAKKIGQVWVVGEILTVKDKSHHDEDSEPDSDATVANIISQVNELMENRVQVIELHISSNGGDVSAGFTIYDYLRKTNLPIITFAYGSVCSMAADIFQIGVIRKMTALSTLMMHHTQSCVSGTPEKMALEAQCTNYVNELSFTLSSMRSGIPLKKLKKMSRPLIYFTAEKAVKLNLADEII